MILATPERDLWLAERMTGIGASEAAAAIGASPWQTPYEVWAEKVGAVEPRDLSDNEAVEWGLRLESPILTAYAERTGRIVHAHEPYTVVRHPEHDWMLATPDAEQHDEAKGKGLAEGKNVGAYMLKEWQDEPPLHYQIQLQHQLACTGDSWGTLVALVGGQRLVWFDAERNDAFIAALIERERDLWECVKSGTPPAIDATALNAAAIARLWPSDNGQAIALPPEAVEWDAELVRLKEEEKSLKARKEQLENLIKGHIGEAAVGVFPGGSYSFKTSNVAGYTVEARTQRTLRRIKARK